MLNHKEKLFTLFLKHDKFFKNHSETALAQIILKLIYLDNNESNINSIQKDLAIIVSGDVNFAEIKSALKILIDEDKLEAIGKKYRIKSEFIPSFKNATDESEELHLRVIKFWFGNCDCDLNTLKEWFEEVTINFFRQYSEILINEVARNRPKSIQNTPQLKQILSQSFLNYSSISDEDKEWLTKQYSSFLGASRSEDSKLLWRYATSMFAATLVNARLFADNISMETFTDSTFILDTNVLMILGLEGYELSDSIAALENELEHYNIKLKYFYLTKEEFNRAINGKREEVISIYQSYSSNVIKNTRDLHITTSRLRQCKSVNDVENFFSTINTIPKKFKSKLELELLDNAELNNEINKSKNNSIIGDKLSKIYFNRTGRQKKTLTKEHDIGLIVGTQYLRKSQNCWILTRDGTICRYAVENPIRDEYPIAISLGVLINLIAMNISSSHIDPHDFADLFSAVIKFSLFPEEDVFTISDLSIMLEVKDQISDLPDETVMDIAKEVNKQRIMGTALEETAKYIQRSFQTEKLKIVSELEDYKEDYKTEHKLKEQTEKENIKLKKELREEKRIKLKKIYKKDFVEKIAIFIMACVIIIASFYFGIEWIEPDNPLFQIVGSLIVSLITFGLVFVFKYPKMKCEYGQKIEGVEKEIDIELDKIIRND